VNVTWDFGHKSTHSNFACSEMTHKGKAISDATLTVGVKQGAGGVTVQPIGGKGPKKKKPRSKKQHKKKASGADMRCWDAFNPVHMALPRAVAPYTVIRTTAIWNPSADVERRLTLFGPSIDVGADGGQWTSAYAYGFSGVLDTQMNTANAGRKYEFSSMETSSWGSASVVPAAFSIQVLNPEALQASNGMVYIGRALNKVHIAESDLNRQIADLANSLVAYSNPRMCSAGKLALRGVQIDAVPNNMSELARFTTLKTGSPTTFTYASTNSSHQEGFNPIFVYNPNGINLQVLVCCEWRVRFDPSNPAYAACRSYKPATEQHWANAMHTAVQAGNGVIDIVEKVARVGIPIAKALGAI